MRLCDHRPVQARNQAPSEQWGSGTLQQAKNPNPSTTNCGILQEGAVPKGELFILRFMPLQSPAVCATEMAAVL